MGQVITADVEIAAAAQFLGTEFGAQVPGNEPGKVLKPVGVFLKMGPESKTWSIRKRFTTSPGGTVVSSVLRQSLDAGGAPGANTDTDVVLVGAEAEELGPLMPGEQLQVVTVGATAAMQCRIKYEVVENR